MSPQAPSAPAPAARAWAWRLLPALLAALIVALASALHHAVLSRWSDEQRAANQLLKQASETLDADVEQLAALRASAQAMIVYEQQLAMLAHQRAWPPRLLRALATLTPEGIFLGEVRMAGDRLQLQGHSRRYEDVAELARVLEASPLFEKVELVELQPAASGQRPAHPLVFSLAMVVPADARPRPDSLAVGRVQRPRDPP